MNIFLSVIVPVYNTSNYLDRCIECILKQSYSNFELILIDDGSDDGCAEKCDYYAQTDERVKVIHQNNMGLVYSRKVGLNKASSNYITFIDSDDWIDNDYLETITNEMIEGVDVLVTNVIRENKNDPINIAGSIKPGVYIDTSFSEAVIPFFIRDWRTGKPGIQPFVVSKMFKKTALKNYLMQCDDHITLGEDGAVSYPCILDSKKIKIVGYAGYHWNVHDGSMSNTFSLENFEKIEILRSYLEKIFYKDEKFDILQPQFDMWIAKDFLIPTIKKFYSFDIGTIACIPPYELLDKGERVVIYGAGTAGKSFVRSIIRSGYAEIVGLVDQNAKGNVCGIMIEKPSSLVNMDFDKIIIAVYSRTLYESIRENIIKLNIPNEKIIWKEYDWG